MIFLRKGCTLVVVLFIGLTAYAQTGTISGTLTDEATGEPLIGAAVIIGPGVGSVTDFDGKFKIEADYGDYTLTSSYVGFEPISMPITLDRKTLVVDKIKMKTKQLREVQVIADVARERETPVAFTNILPAKIEEELASQDIPMIMNSTPGVYATQQGGGDGDARVTIRGFSQRNIAVMIDGVPVNDMENGWVYWSNWFGLDAITRSIQVQRGLGASKIAIPSVGGTMNILTKGIDQKAGGSIKHEIGNNGFMRTSIGLTSGKLKNGWGFTGTDSFKKGAGWVDQNFTEGWFYYAKIEKKLKKHLFSLSAFGAPQKHGQRAFKRSVGIYDANTASDLGVNTDSIPEYGLQYNQHWGELERYELDANGNKTNIAKENFNTRQNYFHKPQFTLRDFWTVNDKLYISNIAYLSIGNGGGTRLDQTLDNVDDFDENGQALLQPIYDANTGYSFVPTLFLPNDPTIIDEISTTEHTATNFVKASINNHFWFGALTTATYTHSEELKFSGGLDVRSYKGEHYREVYDLLGADYTINSDNSNDPNTIKRVGDKVDYHNDALVRWGGGFGQVEFKNGLWSWFVNLSGAVTGYKRIDYFLPRVVEGSNVPVFYEFNGWQTLPSTPVTVDGTEYTPASSGLAYQESDWKTIPGFTVKGGANYNLTERMNVFANVGYLSRAPRFANVFDFSNKFYTEIKNELIRAVELGWSYRNRKIASNLNSYYTNWKNRPVTSRLSVPFPDGDRTVNINGMDAVHMGVELDFAYKVTPKLTAEGVVSLGDWRWNSVKDSITFLDEKGNVATVDGTPTGPVYYESFDAVGVHVGDAAQTQIGASIKYEIKKGFYVKSRFTFFDRHWAQFDPITLKGDDAGRESWQMPSYYLVDFHAGFSHKVGNMWFNWKASLLNATGSVYLSDAQNNESRALYIDETNLDFDATSAGVFYGMGMRFNTSLRINFDIKKKTPKEED